MFLRKLENYYKKGGGVNKVSKRIERGSKSPWVNMKEERYLGMGLGVGTWWGKRSCQNWRKGDEC